MSSDKVKPNKAVPDYKTPCDNCGQTPTVTIVNSHGKVETHTELCGVCCFGEAACIDPSEW